MEESARKGLLVDGAGAPLAEEDSGSVELLDGTSVAYHAIAPDNAPALPPLPERAFDLLALLRRQAGTQRRESRVLHERGWDKPLCTGCGRSRAPRRDHSRGELRSPRDYVDGCVPGGAPRASPALAGPAAIVPRWFHLWAPGSLTRGSSTVGGGSGLAQAPPWRDFIHRSS